MTERQNKANKMFALMMASFSCFALILVFTIALDNVQCVKNTTSLFFALSDILQLYTVADFILLWKNELGKEVNLKLINSILQRKNSAVLI